MLTRDLCFSDVLANPVRKMLFLFCKAASAASPETSTIFGTCSDFLYAADADADAAFE